MLLVPILLSRLWPRLSRSFCPFSFWYSDQTIESYVNNYIPFNVWLLLQCPFFSISFPTSANAKLATFALVVVDTLGSPYERDWHWYLRGAYSYSDSNPKTTRLQKPWFHGLVDDSSQISFRWGRRALLQHQRFGVCGNLCRYRCLTCARSFRAGRLTEINGGRLQWGLVMGSYCREGVVVAVCAG